MAHCPNCTKNIDITDDNFGTLYRCEHCRAEFFIGFDGAPENSKEPLATDLIPESTESKASTQITEPVANEILSPLDSGMALDYGLPENDPYAQQPQSNDLFNIPDNQDTQSQIEETASPTGDAFKSFTEDVQNFGNDVSENGLLSFDIEISGIDLGETKRDLMEALEDKRFGWNIEDLIHNMKDGKLTISNVSAPKIIVLVKRITALGLVLNWRHHVAIQ